MIYAYLRLSTSEDKQKNSFDVQLNEIKKNYHIVKVFKETISGSSKLHKRYKLLELLELIKRGDQIIVLRLDRISRDTVQSGWIRYEIEKRGAELISLENTKKDNTTKLIENILLAFAQYEREVTLWRINAAINNKRSKGEALGGGVAKYGYDFKRGEDGVKYLVLNAVEQKVITRIKKYRGKTPGRIAQILSEDGVCGKSGKPIERKQVQRILEAIEKEKNLKREVKKE